MKTATEPVTYGTWLPGFLRAPTLRRMRGRARFAAAVGEETPHLKHRRPQTPR